jgi:hypothetical protein
LPSSKASWATVLDRRSGSSTDPVARSGVIAPSPESGRPAPHRQPLLP